MPIRLLTLRLAPLAFLALAACASEPFDDQNELKRNAIAIGVAAPVGEPAEFVRASRPANAPDYIPVGVTPPPRAEAPRDAEAQRRLESELDAERRRSQAYARRPVPRSTYDGSRAPRVEPPPPELMPE
jgi:hypothetical protein